uniref:ZnMc domain-containing protein n=1 Tax=Syphacia muris TaxID=451379 RepID=A0A0N5AE06_9BILA
MYKDKGWDYNDKVDEKDFLVNYGFMYLEADDYIYHLALARYQRESGLKVSGKLDDATLFEMQKPRCNDDSMNRKGRWKRFGQQRRANNQDGYAKWELGPNNTLHLTWFVSRCTNKLTRKQVSDAVQMCFESWQKRSKIPSLASLNLTFEEVGSEEEADINILFAEGQHGDSHPFDGKAGANNILAHTFYPKYTVESLSGDIHLDDAEDWTVSENGFYGTKLENVLLHEIGHSLGLTHSFRKEAVMYPVYNDQPVNNMEFDIDDRCALNWIYMGPSNTCLFVWVTSEVLARQVNGDNPDIEKSYTGVENNLIDVEQRSDIQAVFRTKLRGASVPRCIKDNGVLEHVERLLRIKLYLNTPDSERYAKLCCKFLDGMYKVVTNAETEESNKNVKPISENDQADGNRMKRSSEIFYNFENDERFDEDFFERFFKFYFS